MKLADCQSLLVFAICLMLGGCASLTCEQMRGQSVPSQHIGLPVNGAIVMSAETIAAKGVGLTAVGEYCKVLGLIKPIDANAPPIGFQLNLPTSWNQKAMMFGGGGYDGVLATFPSGENNVHGAPLDKPKPLSRGYATYGSDSGHTQKPPFIYGRDGSFALNDEALKNYAFEALKKTHDVADFLIRLRYGRAPVKTYFQGGSIGGREALQVVQRWPQDFDGVIAWFPAWNAVNWTLASGKIARALAQPGGYLNHAKRKLVHEAGIAACDLLDGVGDGIISNVAACNARFDPATATVAGGKPLRCEGGKDKGDECLSDMQIAALNTMNASSVFNFGMDGGEVRYPGFNIWGADLGMPGSSPDLALNVILGMNVAAPSHPMTPDMPWNAIYYDQWMKYFVARDPTFNSLAQDTEAPGAWTARIASLVAWLNASQTDLSRFKARGGKLLMVHGLSDACVSSRATAQYFDQLKSTMGEEVVHSFVRYFEVPGYGHGSSRSFNAAWDSVGALENWVESGLAPVSQIVQDKTGIPGRSRPLCDYPAWPKYVGSGDPDSASSFVCAIH